MAKIQKQTQNQNQNKIKMQDGIHVCKECSENFHLENALATLNLGLGVARVCEVCKWVYGNTENKPVVKTRYISTPSDTTQRWGKEGDIREWLLQAIAWHLQEWWLEKRNRETMEMFLAAREEWRKGWEQGMENKKEEEIKKEVEKRMAQPEVVEALERALGKIA